MNLLLDTHIGLWVAENNKRLSPAARRLISDPAANVCVSVVSIWEIAIKHPPQRRVGAMSMSAREAAAIFEATGFQLVPVTLAHTLAVEALPPHHDDPFDRLIVATAITEPFRLLTHDARLAAYGAMIEIV
jgi:PIN domain nuclease of toxin-antitoxin system